MKSVVSNWRMVLLSFVFSSFIFLVVPLQTCLADWDLFDFGKNEFAVACGVCTVAIGFLVFLLLLLTRRFAAQLIVSLLLGLLVCLYLETSILSIGLGPINGVGGFHSIFRSVLDAAVWTFVLLLFVVFRKFVNENSVWIAIGVSIMAIASIFDSRKMEADASEVSLSDGFVSRHDVVESVSFSKTRNVVMFILDMTPGTLTSRIMEESPELREKYDGFVAFRNNLCMHEYTSLGLPGLMTGEYQGDSIDFPDYEMSIFGTNSFLHPYVESEVAVYYSGGLHMFGYTNRKVNDRSVREHVRNTWNIFLRPTLEIPNLRLCDVLGIRLSPYLMKQRFYAKGLVAVNKIAPPLPCAEDEYVFSRLAEAGLSNEKLALCVIHTHGLHWPIKFDRHGKPLDVPLTVGDEKVGDIDKYRTAMYEVGYHVLQILGDLMDVMKLRGIYDCTSIVIAADHGCEIMKEGENNGSESSILWVKPENSHGTFRFRDDPTSNCKVKNLMCALKDNSLNVDEMAEKLTVKGERVFRADFNRKRSRYLGGELHWKDWIYDENGKLITIRGK